MIIGVASGKGGTGKTTVATSLGLSLTGMPVHLLDCDVEEPNAHLFLQPTMEHVQQVTTPVPVIDRERCSGCRSCMEICRFNAITVIRDKAMVFTELCHSCGGCLEVCPEQAVTETGRELGLLESGHRGDLRFSHGRMRVGEAMSPPLIRQVRAQADTAGVTIIDAPPGTSCPVITAIRGTDFVVLVTEPTPFGLHDLTLAHQAVQLLGIPCGLVINRADLGDDKTRAYAREQGLPILLEIPFDRRIAECYSRGDNIVEEMPEWRSRFQQLFGAIETLVVGGAA
jgi:MinD superfamily P-loop ATPase